MKSASRTRTKVLSLVTAAAAAMGITAALPTTAEAAPGNVVVVGDSMPANPSIEDYVGSKLPEQARGLTPNAKVNHVGCGSDGLFTGTYARVSGKAVDDFTCPGASFMTGGMRVDFALDTAAQRGKLNGATSEVVIFAGANDTYSRMRNQSLPDIERELYGAIRGSIAKAKHYAPNARVKVVGMPHVANANGGVCLINVIPNIPLGIPAGVVNDVEFHLQWAQVHASHDGGATFVDTKPISDGHEMCSNDRWITGIIDTTARSPHNLMFHMTDAGLTSVATHTARS
ncbi:GDSL-type esterase/lipase family protein [Corynebacterium ciconiae]|uniref:GDSL-type esterase/lipase family protein n=1 Tax=Corynebacterium ciconiae TaxID=227319 RepID=UPI0005907AF8|nr:GDSL-type esterase/lipase family protein [Corynebacterium ciconiae]